MTNFVSPDTLAIIINEGCKNRINNKTLTEISYTTFMKTLVSSADFNNKNHLFLIDGGEHSVNFVNQLYTGYNSAPRTKKGCTEVLKDLNGKIGEFKKNSDGNDGLPTMEELLKKSFKKEKAEEAKQGDAADSAEVDYDELKVTQIMKLFAAPSKSAKPAKKDFRSFLKQQKTQVASLKKDDGLVDDEEVEVMTKAKTLPE